MNWWDEYAATHEPLIHIGGREDPYMIRWAMAPHNRQANVFLHHFLRSDDDRALHDHPWDSFSVLLSGRLREIDHEHPEGRLLLPGATRIRSADYAHRLIVEEPGFTIFTTGPKIREWGFLCEQGWRHWTRFTTGENGQHVGLGCADFGDPFIEGTPA